MQGCWVLANPSNPLQGFLFGRLPHLCHCGSPHLAAFLFISFGESHPTCWAHLHETGPGGAQYWPKVFHCSRPMCPLEGWDGTDVRPSLDRNCWEDCYTLYLSRKESSKCCQLKIQTRLAFVGNGFLLYALTIFFQILCKVLQVPHRNSVHSLVISGEASKKKYQFSSISDALYITPFSVVIFYFQK